MFGYKVNVENEINSFVHYQMYTVQTMSYIGYPIGPSLWAKMK